MRKDFLPCFNRKRMKLEIYSGVGSHLLLIEYTVFLKCSRCTECTYVNDSLAITSLMQGETLRYIKLEQANKEHVMRI